MKRLVILALMLACVAGLCLGQRRGRVTERQIIQLTEPQVEGTLTFEQALLNRQDVTQFSPQSLKPAQISQLAWAGQGIIDPQRGLRTAPSEGLAYPLELYFATQDGLSVYRPAKHSMEQTSEQDFRATLAAATSQRDTVAGAGCDIIIAGYVRKLAERFGNKARPFALLEAGHVAQNIQLQAVCLDLGAATVFNVDAMSVRNICNMSRDLEPLCIVSVGYPVGAGTSEGQADAGQKKAVFIVPSQNFRDEELFETKRLLDAAQIETVVASTRLGIVRGELGGMADARVLVDQLRIDDYDAIIFISGSGVIEYVTNPIALDIAREAVRKGKVLAATGLAPSILANANVLAGIRATSFLSERERLIMAGAIYTGNPVEWERLIITATGPTAAIQFGRAIAEALTVR